MERSIEKRCLSISECARSMGISDALCRKMVKRGEIPSIKAGDRYLIPKSALEKLLSGDKAAKDRAS